MTYKLQWTQEREDEQTTMEVHTDTLEEARVEASIIKVMYPYSVLSQMQIWKFVEQISSVERANHE